MGRKLLTEGRARTEAQPAGPVRVPHDPVNEQVLLAAAVVNREARRRLVKLVPPDRFQVSEHVEAWGVLAEMERRGLEFDASTVSQLSGGRVDPQYLLDLASDRDTVPPNLMHHVAMLEWDATRVTAVKGPLAQLLQSLTDPTTPPERVRAQAAAVQSVLSSGSTLELVRDPGALTRQVMASVEERQQQACYPYGIEGLDKYADGTWRLIPGCAPGKVTVITGSSGSGKSTVTARIGLAQRNLGRRVLYGAWEMHAAPTLELLAAMELGWSRYKMSTASYTADDKVQLQQVCDELGRDIKFVEAPGAPKATSNVQARGERATNERALDQLFAVMAETGADVFIGDLFKRTLREIDPEDEEQALVRLQDIAAKTKCHCILLQQQRKDNERADHRPTRDTTKGSAAWIEVPDTVLGVHRPALWKAVDDVTLELLVLKQRWAKWPLAIEFDWDSDKATLTNGRDVAVDAPGPDFGGSRGGGGFLDDDKPKKGKAAGKGKGGKRG